MRSLLGACLSSSTVTFCKKYSPSGILRVTLHAEHNTVLRSAIIAVRLAVMRIRYRIIVR